MENYENLKSLSKYNIIIAWIIAIITLGIVSFLVIDGENFIDVIPGLVVGLLIGVFLLSFGKLTQYLIIIREHQIKDNDSDNEESDSKELSNYIDIDKFKSLKLLSKIIIVFAWLNLISSILLFIYNLVEGEDFVDIVSILALGIVLNIFLLTFGKVILLIFDIRRTQLDRTKIQDTIEESIKVDSDIDNIDSKTLEKLNYLIKKQKKKLLGAGYIADILDILSNEIISTDRGRVFMNNYKHMFETDLIADIKSLSSSYSSIKENLVLFIEYKIVEENYPHDII